MSTTNPKTRKTLGDIPQELFEHFMKVWGHNSPAELIKLKIIGRPGLYVVKKLKPDTEKVVLFNAIGFNHDTRTFMLWPFWHSPTKENSIDNYFEPILEITASASLPEEVKQEKIIRNWQLSWKASPINFGWNIDEKIAEALAKTRELLKSNVYKTAEYKTKAK